jgi:hypothetical protein
VVRGCELTGNGKINRIDAWKEIKKYHPEVSQFDMPIK